LHLKKPILDAKNCLTNNKDDTLQRLHHVTLLWLVELETTDNEAIDAGVIKR
jgi:hypothetical protein